ncbi:MAG: hypothetical protein ACYTG4_04525 [Planctomycetota bacterium]|jgi:hypothetical protein
MALHPIRDAILKGTMCANLCTKGMYVPGDEEKDLEDHPQFGYIPDTAVFWCNLSGWSTGPDDLPVDPDRCCERSRSCFEVELEV